MNSSLNPLPYVSAASNKVTPRSNALCMSAIASPSVKFPHQPVEIVHKPKPTSLTVRSVFLYVRKRMPLLNHRERRDHEEKFRGKRGMAATFQRLALTSLHSDSRLSLWSSCSLW